MKTSKKGMAMNTIIVIIIALVVLIVILFIFKDQIGKAVSGYTKISTETGETLEGKRCENLLGDRQCQDGPCSGGTKKVNLPFGQKNWSDCTGKICCEEVY